MADEELAPTVEEQLESMRKVIDDQNRMIQKLSAKEGIKSARQKQKLPEIVFTTEQKAERELRSYIVNAGVIRKKDGKPQEPRFRKGLSEKKKERARKLMKILGRKEMVWDETLLDFRNHQPPVPVTPEDD